MEKRNAEWYFQDLVKHCYGDSLDKDSVQYRDLRKTFYAGAMVSYLHPEVGLDVMAEVITFALFRDVGEEAAEENPQA